MSHRRMLPFSSAVTSQRPSCVNAICTMSPSWPLNETALRAPSEAARFHNRSSPFSSLAASHRPSGVNAMFAIHASYPRRTTALVFNFFGRQVPQPSFPIGIPGE